jgi:hypothetical protein
MKKISRGKPITKISRLRWHADRRNHIIFYHPKTGVERRVFAEKVLEKLGAKVVGWMRMGYLFEEKKLRKKKSTG